MLPTTSLWTMLFGSALSVGVLAALGSAAPAAAPVAERTEVQRTWRVYETKTAVTITYGMPQSDKVVLAVSCERATGVVTVNPFLPVRALRRGAAATITLASAAGRAVIAGRTVYSVRDQELVAEGQTDARELFPVFGGNGTMEVTVPGARETVPLTRNASRAAERLRELCSAAPTAPDVLSAVPPEPEPAIDR